MHVQGALEEETTHACVIIHQIRRGVSKDQSFHFWETIHRRLAAAEQGLLRLGAGGLIRVLEDGCVRCPCAHEHLADQMVDWIASVSWAAFSARFPTHSARDL